jgi:hypothetical protein
MALKKAQDTLIDAHEPIIRTPHHSGLTRQGGAPILAVQDGDATLGESGGGVGAADAVFAIVGVVRVLAVVALLRAQDVAARCSRLGSADGTLR